ncbi:MAG TPA: hypothetical protein VF906_00660 [Candidatus Bathyarchaeia archaeon]
MTAVIAVTGFFVAAYASHIFAVKADCWVRPGNAPNTAIFTIVMADEGLNVGYNGSKAHGASASNPWPIMNVTLGQNVIIHIINNDTQAHGFQVTHYFDQGLGGLAPGKCYDLRFTANELGSFIVRCDISCTIHFPYMQYGQLDVSP